MAVRKTFLALGVLMAAGGIIAGIIGYDRLHTASPQDLFYSALRTGLMQPGITCAIDENTAGRRSHQVIRIDLASRSRAELTTRISQDGSGVATEQRSIGGREYIRYTALTTPKSGGSTPAALAPAINIWATQPASLTAPGLVARTVGGECVVPLADMPSAKADELMREIRRGTVFVTDFGASRLQQTSSRQVRVYDVRIQPKPYVALMRQLGTATGIPSLSAIDASAYANRPTAQVRLYIDVSSQRVEHIDFVGSHRIVKFMEYGKRPAIEAPKQTVSADELARRLAQTKPVQ